VLNNLLSLNLAFNKIGDNILDQVKYICPSLIDLNVSYNRLSNLDTFCLELVNLEKIKSVFVCPNPFTLNKNWRFNFIKKSPNIV